MTPAPPRFKLFFFLFFRRAAGSTLGGAFWDHRYAEMQILQIPSHPSPGWLDLTSGPLPPGQKAESFPTITYVTGTDAGSPLDGPQRSKAMGRRGRP